MLGFEIPKNALKIDYELLYNSHNADFVFLPIDASFATHYKESVHLLRHITYELNDENAAKQFATLDIAGVDFTETDVAIDIRNLRHPSEIILRQLFNIFSTECYRLPLIRLNSNAFPKYFHKADWVNTPSFVDGDIANSKPMMPWYHGYAQQRLAGITGKTTIIKTL